MISVASLPEELHEQVVRAMQPGEEPVWAAQPVPTLVNQLSSPYIFFGCLGLFFFVLVHLLFLLSVVLKLPLMLDPSGGLRER